MVKKLLIFFLVLFMLIPLAIAAPPQTITSSTDLGLTLEVTQLGVHKLGEDIRFHIHVFNSSNGKPMRNESPDDVNCVFHLYNFQGGHLYTEEKDEMDGTYDFEFVINGSNFTTTDLYGYTAQCNNSNYGGFFSSGFDVTVTGAENFKDTSGGIAVTMFILTVALLLFILPFKVEKFSKLPWANLVMKRACFLIGIYLMMLNSTIILSIANSAELGVFNELFRYTWLLGLAGYVFMGYMCLKTLFDLLAMHYTIKKNKRMGEEDSN